MNPYDYHNVANARRLRKEMTPWERRLWFCFLRSYPIRFQRQKCIDRYIADFYCFRAKLVIELDGSQHYEAEGKQKDAQRDAFLRSQGLTVLRYSNADINKNFRGVCEDILNHLHKPSP